MANGEANNRCGRGLPPYLLWRQDSESSIYSDGASRIFLYSDSATSDKDTGHSLASTRSHSFSDSQCPSISSVTSSVLSSTTLSTHNSSVGTRVIENSIHSTNNNDQGTLKFTASIGSGSSISFFARQVYPSPNFAERNDRHTDVCVTYNSYPGAYTDPADMFTPYNPLFSESLAVQRDKSPEKMDISDIVEDGVIVPSNSSTVPISYDQCCLRNDPTVSTCGASSRNYYGWTPDCINFAQLTQRDVDHYLKRLSVIRKTEDDIVIMNEKDLIASRLLVKNIIVDDSMSICPKHRSSFGIDWRDVKSKCHHPDHDPKHHPKASNCRRADLTTCLKIQGFPVGGRLCTTHRKMETAPAELISVGDLSLYTNGSLFQIDDSRETMNRILVEANMSPIRSQARAPLQRQSKSGLRRLVSKLRRGAQNFQEKLAEALAPDEGAELLQIAQLSTSADSDRDVNESINNEIVQNLKKLYDVYVEQKIPFIEQARVLSLLPRSWGYEKIIEMFSCTRHAIKTGRQIQDDNENVLKLDKEPVIRQRADPNKIKHFVSWLVESDTLVSGTYGLTTLKMDNGDTVQLSKQILQSQKTHAIANYKKYCEETEFESLCNRKLFDILNGLKPAQQRALAGLDEFVVEGVEAWQCLSDIVSSIPIPQTDRKRLLKQISMAEQYQKTAHSGHCSENSECITHCTTFGLSDPKCAQHYCECTRQHVTMCSDCINIIVTLDEISEKINKIADEELKCETKYDFENASQHIIEWSRHNLRAACQSDGKNKIISQMRDDEAFCTFDWGQKILPQEFRESQSAYFGKRGMSVLVGSFVWKKSSKNAETISSSSESTFQTESYILALTNAAQTDLDSLSAYEIILKQFQQDYPHVKKLHKRTDNAGNISSHSTPEAEKLICDRLSIQLLTRDYSEVQKGKDICDRVCGVAKARMRSWVSIGHDLLNANDIKEGMEYAGGIKSTKVAVAEIIPGRGFLDKTNVPNVSTIRSIEYGSKQMKVFKASNIGQGVPVFYKKIDFETNMRLISPFSTSINDQESTIVSKKRSDREHHGILMCPVNSCTSTFECSADLDSHIAANLHDIPAPKPRTSNDIARLHLVETLRTANIQSQQGASTIRTTQNTLGIDMSGSAHYEFVSSPGWALRVRKNNNPLTENIKAFIEDMWLDSQRTRSKLTPEQVQQQIRNERDKTTGKKLFQSTQYATINQIKYHIRKLGTKHGITAKDKLIEELVEENIEKN